MKLIENDLFKNRKNYFGFIYVITNKINNKIYIGQTKDVRQRIRHYRYNYTHNKADTLMGKKLLKYGIDNFIITLIEGCKDIDQMNKREIFWIAKLDSMNREIGYNTDAGGKNHTTSRFNGKYYDNETKILLYNYFDDNFLLFESAKKCADFLDLDRTNVTKAVRKATCARGFFVFYYDKDKMIEVVKNVRDKVRNNEYSNSQLCKKREYLSLCKRILVWDVETIKIDKKKLRKLKFKRKKKEKKLRKLKFKRVA